MYSIGEFSKIVRLPIKTLRFYHERKLLVPSHVDAETGYRYYNDGQVERARIIVMLRDLEFSLDQITDILADCTDDSQLTDFLVRRKNEILFEIKRQRDITKKLEHLIQTETKTREIMASMSAKIEVKDVEPMLIAGIRMKGRYSDCGKGFSKLGKSIGRFIGGKAMCLFYDEGYREEDADFEPCFPVKKQVDKPDIDCRELPGRRCISLIHKGPYDEVGPTYQQLIAYAKSNQLQLLSPGREIYIKGPGMIFKGNPKNYLTEVQIPVTDSSPGKES